MPLPSSLEEVRSHPEVKAELAEGAFLASGARKEIEGIV